MITPMPLPFARDAIVPQMSLETFEYHYDRHFMAYVNKTNELAGEQGGSLEDIVRNAHESSTALFQAAGQTWNHAFFWMSLSPEQGSSPSDDLAGAIVREFGSLDAFGDAFAKAGASQFGSGWCWLVADGSGALSLATTHDAIQYGSNRTPHRFWFATSGNTPITSIGAMIAAAFLGHSFVNVPIGILLPGNSTRR